MIERFLFLYLARNNAFTWSAASSREFLSLRGWPRSTAVVRPCVARTHPPHSGRAYELVPFVWSDLCGRFHLSGRAATVHLFRSIGLIPVAECPILVAFTFLLV